MVIALTPITTTLFEVGSIATRSRAISRGIARNIARSLKPILVARVVSPLFVRNERG